ncbi:MAG: hypothetical protein QG652_1282 [Pseudomonadota bacterium]|nr:hypothetical protein [Pseudomonadota bacterium]
MITIRAYRYDGASSARTPVELLFTPTGIRVSNHELLRHYDYTEVTLQPELAGKFSQLRFADGSQCDMENQPGLNLALQYIPGHGGHRFIHAIENNLLYVLLALLLSMAVLAGIIQYAVPVMAREVAQRIPAELETDMGREALELFDHIMQPSALDENRQTELRKKFMELAAHAGVVPENILFRRGNEIGANAFALPSGIIIFTDEIVDMAKDDRELLAVFAHELGHVKHRHTMQHVLQNSVVGLLVITLTGDIGTASSLAAALPTLLVQSRFSRDFEMQADDFALALLEQQNMEPVWLGTILQRMAQQTGDDVLPNFLSTHPATDERIRKFNNPEQD